MPVKGMKPEKVELDKEEATDRTKQVEHIRIPVKGKEDEPVEAFEASESTIKLLTDPALLHKIGLKLEKQGYIGEWQNKLSTYLAGTTKDYHRNERICIISKGESGGGKSTITITILEKYFSDCVKSFHRMTAHAPDYWQKEIGTLDGKILLIKQMEGTQDIQYTIQIMVDTTSGGLKILTTSGTPGNMKTEEVALDGIPVLCSTVIVQQMDSQTIRRFFTTYPDDSPEQTKRILIHKAKLRANPSYRRMVETTDKDLVEIPKRLKNESAKYGVSIPFAEVIADIFPTKNLLARSDYDKFCNFIVAITHLHYKQRLSYKTEEGTLELISSPIDYYYAWKIVETSLPKRLAGITDERSHKILTILQKKCVMGNHLLTEDIMKIANTEGKSYAKHTIWETLDDLKDKGFVKSDKSPEDNRKLLWNPTNISYNPFGIKIPDEKIENVYIQFIIDNIGNPLSPENSELLVKSMRAFDLVDGNELTANIVSENTRNMLKI
jgi:hypothetical protein